MKNIFKIVVLLLIVGSTVSCKKDLTSEGVSRVTFFPEFTLSGSSLVYLAKGVAFTDPGATATANGTPCTVTMKVVGKYRGTVSTSINSAEIDQYNIEYTAKNADGFSVVATRNVIVHTTSDCVTSIEGFYTSTTKRGGSLLSASLGSSVNMKYVMVWNTGGKVFKVSNGDGGWYEFGRNYGDAYRAPFSVTATDIPSNTFVYPPAYPMGAFGGSAVTSSMVVTPATKSIAYTTVWDAGGGSVYTFTVVLSQVTF